MHLIIICLMVLAICEPLLVDAKKLVVMMPRKIRRSHSSPLQQLLMYAKKKGHLGHNLPGHRHGYTPQSPKYYGPKVLPFTKDQYPKGGDDFDQGHEDVNHIFVPHGKGITHAVSFGNGYIPFDNYKKRPSVSHHHNYSPENSKDAAYSPTVNLPVGPALSQASLTQQADVYVRNEDYNDENELQEGSNDRAAQAYTNVRAPIDFPKAPAIGAPPYGGVGATSVAQPEGGSGNPPVTIGGGKPEIVLRDTVAFDAYNRQVAELMQKWPGSLGNGHFVGGAFADNHQGTQQINVLSRQSEGNALTGGLFYAGPTLSSSLSQDQGQNGYAVKEDVVDSAPHDFRNIPLQTPSAHPLTVHIPQQPIQTMYQQYGSQIIQQQPSRQIIPHQAPQQIIQHQPSQQFIQRQSSQQIIQQQPSQHIIQQQPSQHIIQQQPSQHIIQQQPSQHIIQQHPSQQIIYQRPANQRALHNFLPHPQASGNFRIPNFQGLVHG